MKITLEVPDKFTKEVQEAVEQMKSGNEVDKLNAVCFWLIRMVDGTNAETATITQNNVHHCGKFIGNWEIKLRRF